MSATLKVTRKPELQARVDWAAFRALLRNHYGESYPTLSIPSSVPCPRCGMAAKVYLTVKHRGKWVCCSECYWSGDAVMVVSALQRVGPEAAITELIVRGALTQPEPHEIRAYVLAQREMVESEAWWDRVKQSKEGTSDAGWWPFVSIWGGGDPTTEAWQRTVGQHVGLAAKHGILQQFKINKPMKTWRPYWLVVPCWDAPRRLAGFTFYGREHEPTMRPRAVDVAGGSCRLACLGMNNPVHHQAVWVDDRKTALNWLCLSAHVDDRQLLGPAVERPKLRKTMISLSSVVNLTAWSADQNPLLDVAAAGSRSLRIISPPRRRGKDVQTWVEKTLAEAEHQAKSRIREQDKSRTGRIIDGYRVATEHAKTYVDDRLVANVRVVFRSKTLMGRTTRYCGTVYTETGSSSFVMTSGDFKKGLTGALTEALERENLPKLDVLHGWTKRIYGIWLKLRPIKEVGRIHRYGWSTASRSYSFKGFEVSDRGQVQRQPWPGMSETDQVPDKDLDREILLWLAFASKAEQSDVLTALTVICSGLMRPAYDLPAERWWLPRGPWAAVWRQLSAPRVEGARLAPVLARLQQHTRSANLPYLLVPTTTYGPSTRPWQEWCGNPTPCNAVIYAPNDRPTGIWRHVALNPRKYRADRSKSLGLVQSYLAWLGVRHGGQLQASAGSISDQSQANDFASKVAMSIDEWMYGLTRRKGWEQMILPRIILPPSQ